MYARSDHVFCRDRIDGVETERAEDVPCTHLAAIFVLCKFNTCDRPEKADRTYSGEAVDATVVVILRDFTDTGLRLGRRTCQGVEVGDVVRRLRAMSVRL